MQQKENVVVKNQVILNSIQDLQRLPLQFINNMRGRFQIKFGMTTLFNNAAFTLIELLVVVLIIGILAAVAVPQYQKAVEHSKATEALSMLSSIAKAYQVYFLANGTFATKFEQLDVDMPFSGNTEFYNFPSDTKSNKDWSFQIEQHKDLNGYVLLYAGRISGKYKGAGFSITFSNPSSTVTNPKIWCIERISSAAVLFDSTLPEGAYCERIMKATFIGKDYITRSYKLP